MHQRYAFVNNMDLYINTTLWMKGCSAPDATHLGLMGGGAEK
jgi:hypothetical protein